LIENCLTRFEKSLLKPTLGSPTVLFKRVRTLSRFFIMRHLRRDRAMTFSEFEFRSARTNEMTHRIAFSFFWFSGSCGSLSSKRDVRANLWTVTDNSGAAVRMQRYGGKIEHKPRRDSADRARGTVAYSISASFTDLNHRSAWIQGQYRYRFGNQTSTNAYARQRSFVGMLLRKLK